MRFNNNYYPDNLRKLVAAMKKGEDARGSEKVGKGWLGVTRIYERSYFTRLTSCEDSLLVGSADAEGNDRVKEDGRLESESASYIQGVSNPPRVVSLMNLFINPKSTFLLRNCRSLLNRERLEAKDISLMYKSDNTR